MGDYERIDLSKTENESNNDLRYMLCLCIDIGKSMKPYIDEVAKKINVLLDAIKKTKQLAHFCEVAIVAYSSNSMVIRDFSFIESNNQVTLKTLGSSYLYNGVEKSLKLINKRKKYYKINKISFFMPMLLLISNGCVSDNILKIKKLQDNIKDLRINKKLTFIPFGVGDNINDEVLGEFLTCSGYFKLDYLNVKFLLGDFLVDDELSDHGDAFPKIDLTKDNFLDIFDL